MEAPSMKARYAVCILIGTGCFAAPSLYASEPHFLLRAEPISQTVMAGQDAKINLVRTNTGLTDERVAEDNAGPLKAEYDFNVRIRDGRGTTPAFTDYGKLVYGPPPDDSVIIDSFKYVTIAAGQSRVSVMNIGKLYKLLPRTTYSVSITLSKKRSAMSTPLTSNVVEIIVK
jgi:hypothetical protein